MKFERTIDVPHGIPTASMADIAFLLLIFFMATTIFKMEEGLIVHLPRAETGERIPREKVTFVWVDAQGEVSINDRLIPINGIEPILVKRLRENPALIVGLKVDASLPYKVMDEVIEQLKRAQALNVAFTHDPEKKGPS
jgi:biopolymer transport protein ExbD